MERMPSALKQEVVRYENDYGWTKGSSETCYSCLPDFGESCDNWHRIGTPFIPVISASIYRFLKVLEDYILCYSEDDFRQRCEILFKIIAFVFQDPYGGMNALDQVVCFGAHSTKGWEEDVPFL